MDIVERHDAEARPLSTKMLTYQKKKFTNTLKRVYMLLASIKLYPSQDLLIFRLKSGGLAD